MSNHVNRYERVVMVLAMLFVASLLLMSLVFTYRYFFVERSASAESMAQEKLARDLSKVQAELAELAVRDKLARMLSKARADVETLTSQCQAFKIQYGEFPQGLIVL